MSDVCSRVGAVLLLLAVAGAQEVDKTPAASQPKGVYGTDDRTDEGNAANCVGEACVGMISTSLRTVASESTVALIPRRKLSYDSRTNSWIPRSSLTLGEAYNMCPVDPTTNTATRFFDQPTLASCSGTIVQWDPVAMTGLVASAAHCFDADGATNGCQNSQGELTHVPHRGADCQWANDGECDEGLDGSRAYCPVGSDSEDCGERQQVESQCDYLFVFDYTNELLQEVTSSTPVLDDCQWAADGECDVPRYCPSNSDLCDCSGINCPQDTPPSVSIPAANVYDCAEIVMCDIENLSNDWAVDGVDASFTDFALARIDASGISSYVQTCSYENDGECDVPTYCPAGTDTADCRTEDTTELRAARTVEYLGLTRAILDGGSPRTIIPATLYSGVLSPGSSLTVVGHPSGLPRKYTGGATVHSVAECLSNTLCPAGDAEWAAYTADLDTFGGNSGSGTFADSGEMVGILISGATDFYHRVGNYGAGSTSAADSCAYSADGECDAGTYCAAGSDICDCTGQNCPEQACLDFARCPGMDGVNTLSHCRLYDTSIRFPAACQDPTSAACYQVCNGAGLEWVSCSGENVAPTAGLINYIQSHLYEYPAGTFSVTSSLVLPVPPAPVTPAPVPPTAPDEPGDMETEQPAVGNHTSVWDGHGDNPAWDIGYGGCDTYAEDQENHIFCIIDGATIQCPVACSEAVPFVETVESICPNEVASCQEDTECAAELTEWSTSGIDPTSPSVPMLAVVTCFWDLHYHDGNETSSLVILAEHCPDEVEACQANAECEEGLQAAFASGEFIEPMSASDVLQAIVTCCAEFACGIPATVNANEGACADENVTLTDNGEIIHTGTSMDHNQLCSWELRCSNPEHVPQLQFTTFHTENYYDFVRLYDGQSSAELAYLHGSLLAQPDTYEGVSSSMRVEYSSDGSINGDGFRATLACHEPVVDACTTGVTLRDSGIIAHRNLGLNEQCTWVLECSEPRTVPQAEFTMLHTESHYDYLFIFDTPDSTGPVHSLHGTEPPAEPIVLSQSGGFVQYISDSSINGEGFEVEFECVLLPAPTYSNDPCQENGVLFNNSASIDFTPLEYDQDCRWTVVCSDTTQVPQLTFVSFDTEENFDYVFLYDGASSTSGVSTTYHGTEVTSEPLSASGPAGHIRYISDFSVNGEGFQANVECVDTSESESEVVAGTEDHETACGNGIEVVHGDAVALPYYAANADCSWTITCPFAPAVLSFTELDIEQDWDFIFLYDGEGSAATQIGDRISGMNLPEPQTSSGATMFVRFIADSSVQRSGFAAYASCPNQEPSICEADEHVVNHMCVYCDPGKQNYAGDDASGPNTDCEAIYCSTNERVAGKNCVACEPGKENSGGDNASGPDTVCTLSPTTGMCVGNTVSSEDIVCPVGWIAKPDPETIACGESCDDTVCCDALPPTAPEIWYMWEATAFESCPAMVCEVQHVTRTVRCVKVSIFSTGTVEREDEVLEEGDTTRCNDDERPSTTQTCATLALGDQCDDRDPATTNDMCISSEGHAQCLGVVALVSAVTFQIPVDNLELPDESQPVENVNTSPIAVAVKASLTPVLEHSFGVKMTEDSIEILRIQSGSLQVDYKVELPPTAATEEAKDAAVAAIANPEAVQGLRPDAMDLTLTDSSGRQVTSNGVFAQQFHRYSYVRVETCSAGQQPGIDSAECPNTCGSAEIIALDSWVCEQDGMPAQGQLCAENGLPSPPTTYTQCCPRAPEDGVCVRSDAAEIEAARERKCEELAGGLEEQLVCLYGEESVEEAKKAVLAFILIGTLGCLCCVSICVACCYRRRLRKDMKPGMPPPRMNAPTVEVPPQMPPAMPSEHLMPPRMPSQSVRDMNMSTAPIAASVAPHDALSKLRPPANNPDWRP